MLLQTRLHSNLTIEVLNSKKTGTYRFKRSLEVIRNSRDHHIEFVHRDDPSRQANVSWRLIDASGNVVLNWVGSTNEAVSIDAELPLVNTH